MNDIVKPDWRELNELQRIERSEACGVPPPPRYTPLQLVIEAIHGINQADPNVIEGDCEAVDDDSDSSEDAEVPEIGLGFEEDY
jgi:hypothetical protein